MRRERHTNARVWQPWEDEVLRTYWPDPQYKQNDIAELLGVSSNTARSRYRELTR